MFKKFNHFRAFVVSAVVALFFATPAAEAGLIGSEVGCNISGGGNLFCDVATATVVDPGVEFNIGPGVDLIAIDLDADTITLNTLIGNILSFTIIELTGLDWFGMAGEIVGVTLESNDGFGGLEQGDLTAGSNSLTIDLRNTSSEPGALAVISLQARHIPEPATLALLGLGLAGFGLARRRRKS